MEYDLKVHIYLIKKIEWWQFYSIIFTLFLGLFICLIIYTNLFNFNKFEWNFNNSKNNSDNQ